MDRNNGVPFSAAIRLASLSARRAWIEISSIEEVSQYVVSLSARRAWIEIFEQAEENPYLDKSLSARRAWIEMAISAVLQLIPLCRSPQGERG